MMNKQTANRSNWIQFPPCVSQRQAYAFWQLREHYALTRDALSVRELRHLRFIRWLYRTGRLAP